MSFLKHIPDNYFLINQIGYLPEPVAGVITLEDNTAYQINGDIDIVGNRIELGNNNIFFGLNPLTDKLRASTLTGNMFTGTGKDVFFDSLQLGCPNGSLFNLNGGLIQILRTSFSATENGGTFNAMSTVAIRNAGSTAQVFTVGGFVFSGTCVNLDVVDCLFNDNAGYVIDLGTSVWNSIIINRNRFTKTVASQRFVNGTASSANIATGGNGNVGGGNYFGGTVITDYFTNINTGDIRWKFFDNGGIPNTKERGSFNMVNNATVTNIITASVPIKIAGTSVAGTLEKFTHSNGRLTYIGVDPITILVLCIASFVAASNSTKKWRFFINKNGTVLTTSQQPISTTTNTLYVEVAVQDAVSLVTNDYVEAWVQNDTDTTDMTADINFQVD